MSHALEISPAITPIARLLNHLMSKKGWSRYLDHPFVFYMIISDHIFTAVVKMSSASIHRSTFVFIF